MTQLRCTIHDLELMPEDGSRYEIIDGELYVSTQPSLEHQIVCLNTAAELRSWSHDTRAGVVVFAPGVIFAEHEAVAPDVVWVSQQRLAALVGPDRKLHAAPDLMVEVLSPGPENERRDREVKLKQYSRWGVREYWIVDWQQRQVAVYCREGAVLQLAETLLEGDVLESRLLPGFSCPVSRFFTDLAAS